ncbi:MAG: hypothetical protein WCK35_16740, partial [Chloroflexota bacterium]
MLLAKLKPGDALYPSLLAGWPVQPVLAFIGNVEILNQPLLGIFCSAKVPASLILKAQDIARELSMQGR